MITPRSACEDEREWRELCLINFATAALQGMLSCPDFDAGDSELVAKYAIEYAEAMMRQMRVRGQTWDCDPK